MWLWTADRGFDSDGRAVNVVAGLRLLDFSDSASNVEGLGFMELVTDKTQLSTSLSTPSLLGCNRQLIAYFPFATD
jgi:hypothetical protein